MFDWLRNWFNPKPCEHPSKAWSMTTIEVAAWNPASMEYEWIKQRVRVLRCLKCKKELQVIPFMAGEDEP